ncbi:MAG: hypothetical protein PVH88_18810 [Ignavibacteria bacterium]|jgi:hypothetical protein
MNTFFNILKRENVDRIITIATLISLIIAIVMMFTTFQLSEEIENVLLNVQTRSIDGFPKNIRFINELLEEAKEEAAKGKYIEVRICVDMPGYGSYSSPSLFEEMDKLIKDLIYWSRNGDVTFYFWYYNESTRRKLLKEQFEEDDFKNWRNKPKYEKYLESLSPELSNEFEGINSFEGLINYFIIEDSLIFHNYEILKESDISHKFHFKEVEKEFPFFCWIVNNKAIISFPEYKDLKGEHSILTYDKELIMFIEKRIGFTRKDKKIE